MYPASIDEYVRPRTTAEALAALARYPAGEAVFLAGGQSAMQAIKARMLRPRCIVDLQAVDELKGIESGSAGVRIGALTRYVELAAANLPPAYAALGDAAARVGDRQVRNRGTIGGSVCWNYPAACTPAVVLALGARLQLLAATGERREIASDDFFRGPLETARQDDELLVAVVLPPPPPRTGSAYRKWGLVTDALPVIGMCVLVTLHADGRIDSARIGLTGLGNGAERGSAGEAALHGRVPDEATVAEAMRALADSVDPPGDASADASYRKQLIRTLGAEVARSACARARG
jgi:aerobic carbon-monoxide dehydrogenase medium subunit